MIFTSGDFFTFAIIVYLLYFLSIKNLKINNYIILISSYVFYSWIDWRLSFLLLFSSAIDFVCSIQVEKNTTQRKYYWLLVSVISNLSILGFFKYVNFFIESFSSVLMHIGISINAPVLNILLPVGISFYTFQSMSYTIDVYNGRIAATRNAIAYFCYVSFFPQLVAGPIERAGNLLRQMSRERIIETSDIYCGSRLILFGFFKKVVLADNLAIYVDHIYSSPQSFSSLEIFTATWLFSFQIYFDFSAYSDIARGLARILGFDLMLNFRSPYLSRSIREFWTRWHISLSTFFRDYVFIPLGGSQSKIELLCKNIIIVFCISGLWHGAKWTFVLWGAYHAAGYLIELLKRRLISKYRFGFTGHILNQFGWPATFLFIMLGWVLFRAETLSDAMFIYGKLLDYTAWTDSNVSVLRDNFWLLTSTIVFLCTEALYAWNKNVERFINEGGGVLWLVYAVVFLAIFWLGEARNVAFIYFRF